VLVSDLPEKLDSVLAREERRGDRMNGRVTPALFVWSKQMSWLVVRSEGDGKKLYLIVKATTAIEVVEECRVGLAAPKVHISNLKIAPNCMLIVDRFSIFSIFFFRS
jgi:hypothetical protein